MKRLILLIFLVLTISVFAHAQANSVGQTKTLSNAVAVSGRGATIDTERWGAVRLSVTISASDTVSFEVYNGSAWVVTKNAFNVDLPTTAVNGATATGTFIIVTNGMPFSAPVTHVSGTTITVATQIFVTVAKAVAGSAGGGGGDALTTDPLSQFASTTSAQFLGVISNETGSGLVVGNTSPTLVTPVLGVATVTTINKVAFTAPATGSTLTIADGKTLTASNTLTLAGTDSTVMTFPSTSATIARTDAANTFTGVQTMTSPSVTTSLVTGSTTFALLNTTATTVNAFGVTTALNIGAGAATILNFGGHTTAGEFRFLEPSGSGTNYSAFKAVAQGASITYSLPPAVGAAGTVLTDVAGDGVLTWAAGGGGGGANPAGSGSELNARLDGTTFQAVTGSSISGAVITLTGAPIVQVTDTDETTVTTLLTLFHRNVAGQPQQNYGTGILMRGSDDENSADDMAKVSTIWSDPTGGSEDSDLTVQLRTGGSALAEKWRFSGLGNLTIAGAPTITASATNAGIILAPNGTGSISVMNGANPQTVNVYGGFTDVSNYTRLRLEAGTGYKEISVANAGSFVGAEVLYISNTTNDAINFKTNNTTRFIISNAGVFTLSAAGYETCSGLSTVSNVLTCVVSTRKVKQGFADFNDGLEAIRRIQPQTFSYRANTPYFDNNRTHLGLIAENLQAANPLLVSLTNQTATGLLQPEPMALHAITISAVQALDAKITRLENELAALKAVKH